MLVGYQPKQLEGIWKPSRLVAIQFVRRSKVQRVEQEIDCVQILAVICSDLA